ncbi:MAG: hypothetical protein HYY96_02805 [Candidatus Tectomicrobia bacterium]|nr:hypothetical protein [Candidatus Tectomicrobia bacterium]
MRLGLARRAACLVRRPLLHLAAGVLAWPAPALASHPTSTLPDIVALPTTLGLLLVMVGILWSLGLAPFKRAGVAAGLALVAAGILVTLLGYLLLARHP